MRGAEVLIRMLLEDKVEIVFGVPEIPASCKEWRYTL